jgi:hypothetical protein
VDISGFTLTTGNGDGFVVAPDGPFVFTLNGSDNGQGGVITTFGTVAGSSVTVSGQFRYQTNDGDGSSFDLAGFFLNDAFTQLSLNGQPNGSVQTGLFSFAVNAGDSYGFYINSIDSVAGRAQLSVTAVPEPTTWAMLIVGFGLIGATMRRRVALTA